MVYSTKKTLSLDKILMKKGKPIMGVIMLVIVIAALAFALFTFIKTKIEDKKDAITTSWTIQT